MAFEKKVSEMIIDVSGTLFDAVDNQQEMQAHLDLVLTAWNMAIKSPVKRKREFERFLEEQKDYASSAEALKRSRMGNEKHHETKRSPVSTNQKNDSCGRSYRNK